MLNPINPILIIDNSTVTIEIIEFVLKKNDYNNLISTSSGTQGISFISKKNIELIILDISMPLITGEEILSKIKRNYSHIPVIILTSKDDVETAVRCLLLGVVDYLLKPVVEDKLLASIQKITKTADLQKEDLYIKKSLDETTAISAAFFEKIITQDLNMYALFKYIDAIKHSREPVLITGETGVGKELMAEAVHFTSRVEGDFIKINVAGLDDHVFSDTLFGHSKGAFTGALKDRAGLIEKAKDGTIFLDEIGDLNLSCQVKLLRVVQDNEYYAIGDDVPKKSAARIILATNKSIDYLHSSENFRTDLFFRISVHHIEIPPLRERIDDLKLLLEYFMIEASEKLKKKRSALPKELFSYLSIYNFPGNIRELRAMIFNAVVMNQEKTMSLNYFRKYITIRKSNNKPDKSNTSIEHTLGYFPTLKQVETLLIDQAMDKSSGNQGVAAELLGVTRQTINRKLKK